MRKLISLNNVTFASQALLKGVFISPKKVNEIARIIIKRNVEDAKRILFCSKKKCSELLYKLIISAIANAKVEDNSLLFVMEASVGRGAILKKVAFFGRGKRGIERKRSSNIKIVLGTILADVDKKISLSKEVKNGTKS